MSVTIPHGKEIEVFGRDILAGYLWVKGHKVLLVYQDPDIEYTKAHVFASLDFCVDYIRSQRGLHPKVIIADLPARPANDLVLYISKYIEYFKIFAQEGVYLFLVTSPKVSSISTFLVGVIERAVSLSLRVVNSMDDAVHATDRLMLEWKGVMEYSEKIETK